MPSTIPLSQTIARVVCLLVGHMIHNIGIQKVRTKANGNYAIQSKFFLNTPEQPPPEFMAEECRVAKMNHNFLWLHNTAAAGLKLLLPQTNIPTSKSCNLVVWSITLGAATTWIAPHLKIRMMWKMPDGPNRHNFQWRSWVSHVLVEVGPSRSQVNELCACRWRRII